MHACTHTHTHTHILRGESQIDRSMDQNLYIYIQIQCVDIFRARSRQQRFHLSVSRYVALIELLKLPHDGTRFKYKLMYLNYLVVWTEFLEIVSRQCFILLFHVSVKIPVINTIIIMSTLASTLSKQMHASDITSLSLSCLF